MGVEADEWRVASDPFAHGNGRWPVSDYGAEGLPGPGLKRGFGQVIDSITTRGLAVGTRRGFLVHPAS